jgi:hypothetical protein
MGLKKYSRSRAAYWSEKRRRLPALSAAVPSSCRREQGGNEGEVLEALEVFDSDGGVGWRDMAGTGKKRVRAAQLAQYSSPCCR